MLPPLIKSAVISKLRVINNKEIRRQNKIAVIYLYIVMYLFIVIYTVVWANRPHVRSVDW